jgi:hypothetical protein
MSTSYSLNLFFLAMRFDMNIQTLIKTTLYYAILFVASVVCIQRIWFVDLFERDVFLNWDAGHYHTIKEEGYHGFRVAFFPLFPMIWRFLSLGTFGISIFNALVFFTSFVALLRNLHIRRTEYVLLYLTVPCFIFFYLPFTESLFFLCSTLIIVGLKNNKDHLVYMGLYLAILCRPAFTVLIPALFITEFLQFRRDNLYFRLGAYTLISLLGILTVGWIQYLDTNEWFKFFSAQKEWGNHLQLPKLPFHSWADGIVLRTDGVALFIGVIAGAFLSALLLKLKWVHNLRPTREVIFSLAYLGGITLSVILFRGGSLFSLNRFVFATPFIIVAIHYWIHQKIQFKAKHLTFIFGLVFLFWLLLGSYVHLQEIIKFGLLSIYVLLLFALQSEKDSINKYSIYVLITINFVFQIFFYLRVLNGEWIG